MKMLRDLKESTTLLILFELTTGRHTKLKTIAEKLGITIQGISEYLKSMIKNGLVTHIRGEYKATNKGVELLHENFTEMKEFIDDSMKKLDIVNVCVAIAGNVIRKGDKVGLFMENGILTAYSDRKAGSTGTAISDAKRGEDVGIEDLDGIVSLKPGKLWIVQLPNIEDGGSRGVSLNKTKELYFKNNPDRLAALDTIALSLIMKLKLKYHIEYAAPDASIEALQKGLNVMVFGSEEEVHRFISKVNEFNTSLVEKINYRLISLD